MSTVANLTKHLLSIYSVSSVSCYQMAMSQSKVIWQFVWQQANIFPKQRREDSFTEHLLSTHSLLVIVLNRVVNQTTLHKAQPNDCWLHSVNSNFLSTPSQHDKQLFFGVYWALT